MTDEKIRQKENSDENQKKIKEKNVQNDIRTSPITFPFPPRQSKLKADDIQFKKFLEIFSQLHINIPFVEDLKKMPTYAKFMKYVLTRKTVFEEFETVAMTKSSFCLPWRIGILNVISLCELRASINLMFLSFFQQLKVGEVRPTTIYCLSRRKTILATTGTLIYVKKGEVTLRVNDEKITFNMFKALKQPFDMEECSFVRVTDNLVNEKVVQLSKVTHEFEEIE
ncbi:uncharacterized protein LOC111878297 [Lactuca sativa]|uniref:Uncharacterized protein n=1 Tax=Lactuca sativa TaxID=4236 RepID=A0A9R1XC60_LACSA|nr:uncharacterized protein LOC111878297 [Lactuca sativa]KAJ0207321.1 hypothetical protein LSAT_V11C500266830 [Lactuca sativa]